MDKSLVSPTNNINKFLESFLARELFSREFGILALFSNKREKENITRNILSLSLSPLDIGIRCKCGKFQSRWR